MRWRPKPDRGPRGDRPDARWPARVCGCRAVSTGVWWESIVQARPSVSQPGPDRPSAGWSSTEVDRSTVGPTVGSEPSCGAEVRHRARAGFRELSRTGPAGQRVRPRLCDGVGSAVRRGESSGARRSRNPFGRPLGVVHRAAAGASSWDASGSLPVGQPGSGSCPAGGASSGAPLVCRVPGLEGPVSLAADGYRGHLSGAAVVRGRRSPRVSSAAGCRASSPSGRAAACASVARSWKAGRGCGFGRRIP